MQNIRNFVILAHIDHGKSTLADRFLDLTGTIEKRQMKEQFLDQMELERERGITIKLQPVRMNYSLQATNYTLNLIDTPGHVDFTYEVSRSLAAVEGAILLVDATKGVQAQTLANFGLAQKRDLTIIPVINKIDLPNARVDEVEQEMINLLSSESDRLQMKAGGILKISAKTGEGTEEVLREVIKRVPSPESNEHQLSTEDNFRALIFDSEFESYKGIIAYVRVFGGHIKAGQQIRLYESNTKANVVEVGYFVPQLSKGKILDVGEIGYIATGLKDPGTVRVGDTIVFSNESAKPLPGYQEPKSMVFASFYPDDGDDFDLLADALSKVKLTDASLNYEPAKLLLKEMRARIKRFTRTKKLLARAGYRELIPNIPEDINEEDEEY